MAVLDLTTYKAYAGIASTTDNSKHSLIINAVNAFIEGYCERAFTTYYDLDKVEYFDADDKEIFTDEYPIVSITSLEYSTDNGETFSESLSQYTDFIVSKDSESIIAINDKFATVTNSTGALKLTYKAGYEQVPKDLALAAAHLVEYYVKEEYVPRKSLQGASLDNVIQPDMTARLPAHIRRVLDRYRHVVL